jgi:beta-lactamase superfamily II metal-dependent hydrolase
MTTELKIFDVRHGFCAALLSGDNLILIDCGHDSDGFRPLEWLYQKGYRHIDSLIVSNFDQDHITDIKAVRDYFTVGSLAVNPTVSPDALKNIKIQGGPISEQMQVLINSMANPNLNSVWKVPHRVNDTNLEFYCVYYPHETDTNNLSLVTFIQFGTSYIIYPGDLERSGWLKLLAVPDFVARLRQVNVFIASHHGRVNGYCEEVFQYCAPEVVIISDKERTFLTQEHDMYSKHTIGVNFGTILTPKIRKVLTTRNDGHLTLHKVLDTTYVKSGL